MEDRYILDILSWLCIFSTFRDLLALSYYHAIIPNQNHKYINKVEESINSSLPEVVHVYAQNVHCDA